jgi:hypothetical protein
VGVDLNVLALYRFECGKAWQDDKHLALPISDDAAKDHTAVRLATYFYSVFCDKSVGRGLCFEGDEVVRMIHYISSQTFLKQRLVAMDWRLVSEG